MKTFEQFYRKYKTARPGATRKCAWQKYSKAHFGGGRTRRTTRESLNEAKAAYEMEYQSFKRNEYQGDKKDEAKVLEAFIENMDRFQSFQDYSMYWEEFIQDKRVEIVNKKNTFWPSFKDLVSQKSIASLSTKAKWSVGSIIVVLIVYYICWTGVFSNWKRSYQVADSFVQRSVNVSTPVEIVEIPEITTKSPVVRSIRALVDTAMVSEDLLQTEIKEAVRLDRRITNAKSLQKQAGLSLTTLDVNPLIDTIANAPLTDVPKLVQNMSVVHPSSELSALAGNVAATPPTTKSEFLNVSMRALEILTDEVEADCAVVASDVPPDSVAEMTRMLDMNATVHSFAPSDGGASDGLNPSFSSGTFDLLRIGDLLVSHNEIIGTVRPVPEGFCSTPDEVMWVRAASYWDFYLYTLEGRFVGYAKGDILFDSEHSDPSRVRLFTAEGPLPHDAAPSDDIQRAKEQSRHKLGPTTTIYPIVQYDRLARVSLDRSCHLILDMKQSGWLTGKDNMPVSDTSILLLQLMTQKAHSAVRMSIIASAEFGRIHHEFERALYAFTPDIEKAFEVVDRAVLYLSYLQYWLDQVSTLDPTLIELLLNTDKIQEQAVMLKGILELGQESIIGEEDNLLSSKVRKLSLEGAIGDLTYEAETGKQYLTVGMEDGKYVQMPYDDGVLRLFTKRMRTVFSKTEIRGRRWNSRTLEGSTKSALRSIAHVREAYLQAFQNKQLEYVVSHYVSRLSSHVALEADAHVYETVLDVEEDIRDHASSQAVSGDAVSDGVGGSTDEAQEVEEAVTTTEQRLPRGRERKFVNGPCAVGLSLALYLLYNFLFSKTQPTFPRPPPNESQRPTRPSNGEFVRHIKHQRKWIHRGYP